MLVSGSGDVIGLHPLTQPNATITVNAPITPPLPDSKSLREVTCKPLGCIVAEAHSLA